MVKGIKIRERRKPERNGVILTRKKMIIYVKRQHTEKIRPVKWSDDPQSQHNSI